MTSSRIASGFALFVLAVASVFAQEDPEAVYAKLHAATLAGKTEEVLAYGTAATQAELASKSQAEKDAMVRSLAQVLPKTYTITETAVAPDGNSAVMHGAGISEFQGRAESYLNAVFKKEGDAWKVSTWGWSNQKPPPIAKPAEAPASPSADAAGAPPQEIVKRTSGPAPAAAPPSAAAPAKPVAASAAAAVVKKPSRAYLDARACLKLPTDKAIMACAEKYR
jgi:hypothetical protein